jgi:hypothetical protein
MRGPLVAVVAVLLFLTRASAASAADCSGITCDGPEVTAGNGALNASYLSQTPDGWVASNDGDPANPYTYRLSNPCVVNDQNTGACQGTDFKTCVAPAGRVVEDLVVEKRRLVLPDGTTVDGFGVAPGTAPGTQVGPWMSIGRACTDITALNPAPSPGEVFRYFKELPLPKLTTKQQPPGNGLSGLPVIFFTDGPTSQHFTVDIRGFTVDIAATATAFTWHTGDGGDLHTTDPGAPYPDQTITHDYRSGSYTASLTTTWGATFSIDGGASASVPGTTTTDGPPVTFRVLQARAVLTNPYD